MQTINLIQGSPEWHAHRRNHFNASDAPAMMGVSPYKTRAQLIKEYATGLTEEVDTQTQRIYDKGHRFEELARVAIAEPSIGEDLFPCVGVDGKLSASFDGLTMLNDVAFEHKTLNAKIEAYKTADDIDMMYRIQMEQQLMVSGAEKCLFVASKWGDDNEFIDKREFWYDPDFELRQRIIDGWAQFEKDVANYVPEVVEVQAVGNSPETLPALNIQVTGMVTASNIDQFKAHAHSVIGAINKDLQTDQDFADAEKAVKWCGDVEARLAAAKDHALSQTASIDELFKAIDYISETARQTRLQLEKLVKARKESIRVELMQKANVKYAEHVASLQDEITNDVSLNRLLPNPDFATAIKGLKTIGSINDKIETALANAKILADAKAKDVREKLAWFDANNQGCGELFKDKPFIIGMDTDAFQAIVKNRIAEYEALVQKRHEAAKAADASLIAIKHEQTQTSSPATAKPAQTGEATLTIGLINERLGFAVNAEFLTQLGFEPEQVGKFKKYHESDFMLICSAIIDHIREQVLEPLVA